MFRSVPIDGAHDRRCGCASPKKLEDAMTDNIHHLPPRAAAPVIDADDRDAMRRECRFIIAIEKYLAAGGTFKGARHWIAERRKIASEEEL